MTVRVLLASGDSCVASRLGNALELAGFEVIVVARGADVLRMYPCTAPDILVCDGELPDMDGMRLARRLRRRGVTFPVVLLADGPSDPSVTLSDRLPPVPMTTPLIPAPCDEQRVVDLVRQLTRELRTAIPGLTGFPTRVIWPTARRRTALPAR